MNFPFIDVPADDPAPPGATTSAGTMMIWSGSHVCLCVYLCVCVCPEGVCLLRLCVSRAFDTMHRGILLRDLKDVLYTDKRFLVSPLIIYVRL